MFFFLITVVSVVLTTLTCQMVSEILQLMASSDINSVKKGWTDLSKKHHKLQNLTHEIETSKLDNKGVIYRLKAGKFNSKEQADKLCAELKTEGLNCFTKQK